MNVIVKFQNNADKPKKIYLKHLPELFCPRENCGNTLDRFGRCNDCRARDCGYTKVWMDSQNAQDSIDKVVGGGRNDR